MVIEKCGTSGVDAPAVAIKPIRGIHLTGLRRSVRSPWLSCPWSVHAWRVAPSSRRGGWGLLRLRVGYQVATADRVVGDGELEHAVEDHASAARSTSVEAEDELVEVALEVRLVDRTLMGAQQPSLGQ